MAWSDCNVERGTDTTRHVSNLIAESWRNNFIICSFSFFFLIPLEPETLPIP